MEKLKEPSNDEPILVVKKRFSRGWILIITCLVFAFCLYGFAQNPEVDKIDVIVAYFGFGLFLFGAIGVAYKAILFKKVVLFDDRVEFCFVNKVVTRKYSQIKNCYIFNKSFNEALVFECEPKFKFYGLSTTFLCKKDIYKIKEIFEQKGVKNV